MTALYELRDVRVVYAGREALSIGSLALFAGEAVALTGPNGAGKSTLLRLLAFLEPSTSGSVRFDGQAARPCDALRRQATLLLQSPYLLNRSVRENVEYGLRARSDPHARAKAEAALEMVGLPVADFAERSWRRLSGGEAQRVALAARLALKPRALLLDEPTSALDAESVQRVARAVEQARSEWNALVVVASHDRIWLDGACDREVRLEGGRIAESATCV